MVLVPATISLVVGRKLLRIEKPLLIGAIAGQQCSTPPAITSITQVAQSSVPLLGYTITYALSNFLLPLTGPVLVGVLGVRMTDFLNRNIFQPPHPELLVFLVVALGFLLGKIRYRAIALGAVTGCLVAGLVLGARLGVQINGTVKDLFFIMFLFALGYRVGPQFFRGGLRKDGLPQVVNAVVVCVSGLLISWLFAVVLGYGPVSARG